jgi:hypothetical protein
MHERLRPQALALDHHPGNPVLIPLDANVTRLCEQAVCVEEMNAQEPAPEKLASAKATETNAKKTESPT